MAGNNQKQGETTPAILSIQSAVAYGHVGNNAAMLPLQRLGFDVWPVNTVQLGHHPGYGQFAGHIVEPERLAIIIEGVLSRAPLGACAGLLVGYLGEAAIVEQVIAAWQAIRLEQPDAVFLVDPVIGDDGPGVFVKEPIPTAIRDRLLPLASILTPNRFELALLSGREVANFDQAWEAASTLLDLGPDLVVATGLTSPSHPGHLGLLAVEQEQAWLVLTPRIEQHFSGTGDAFSALFLGHFLQAPDVRTALERAAAAIFSLVDVTAERGDPELNVVAAQDMMADPAIRFPATRMA